MLDVAYKSSDDSVAVVDENGVVTAVGEGNATIIVSVGGDGIYVLNSTNVTVTVSRIATDISVANATVDMKVLDVVDFGPSLTPPDAGNVTYSVSNSSVVKVEDGKIIALAEGEATITVSFEGDRKYLEAENKTIDVTVRLFDASVSASDVNVDVNGAAAIGAVTYPEGLEVEYVSADPTIAEVDGNGTVRAHNAGNTTVTITIKADGIHVVNSTTINVIANRIKTQLVANEVTTTYNINKDLVITLKDGNGRSISVANVTVDLNGAKNYATDANGQVKIPTKGLAPKTYTAKITFDNANYVDIVQYVDVTILKATPKITAKKKTFKKAKKVKKYTVTLKVNGKALAKVELSIKIGKKTFKAKTNGKGKATFKIKKLTKKGKYKANVKFAGNEYYNAVSKKVKLTIK